MSYWFLGTWSEARLNPNYRSELFEQMREKDRKKAEEKRKQELYDLKLEREMQNYDPFGKGWS